jgi:hypothetical protein
MDWHQGSGTIIYDPHRAGMKRDIDGWCIIAADREITRYYRWWLQKERHILLDQPSWDAHISVVRGELRATRHQNWKRRAAMKVNFKYQHGDVQTTKDADRPGTFYWIRVDCPAVDEIRTELGLPTSWKYHHMTIGRTHYDC